MTDMIERVAVAINQAMLLHDDYDPDLLARAAIAAMREPTEEMLTAGDDHTDRYDSEEDDFLNGWRAAIDAALSETKSTTKGEVA